MTPRFNSDQKFSMLLVWTSPRTYSPLPWRTTSMRKAWLEQAIAAVLIRSDQRNIVGYRLGNKSIERRRVRTLDYLANHVPLTGDRADDRGLVAHLAASNVSFLIPMAVFVFAA